MDISISDYTTLIAFWLVFTRWVAIIFQLPMFDDSGIPGIVKILASLVVSYACFPVVSDVVIKDIVYSGENAFWSLTIFNAVVGLVIGFLVKSILSTFIAAGSIITQGIGFGAIRYFDPASAQDVGPFEKLIQWTIVVSIISSGALMSMFKGGLGSFISINAHSLFKFSNVHLFYLDMFKSIFVSAIVLASPIIFINVLVMVVLGIIARTVPQMNVLMVSFVVNIGMGLLVFAATSYEFFNVSCDVYIEKLGQWFQFVT